MKTKIFRFLSISLMALLTVFMFSCEMGSEKESNRSIVKDQVQTFLNSDFGETINNVVISPITSHIGIADAEFVEPTEEDLATGSYSGFINGIKATYTSDKPEVMHAEWVSSKQRTYVKDPETGALTGVEMKEVKKLMFIVVPQEEDTEVNITITASAPYQIGDKTATFTRSRTIKFTVAAKVETEYQEMTIQQIIEEATADWTSFELNGIRDKAEVLTHGVVTEVLWGDGYDTHSFMISDGEHSLYIYAPKGDVVEIGDYVEVVCVPTAYYGIIETAMNPSVKVLYGGQAVPAPKALLTVDEFYNQVSLSDHSIAGQRYVIEGTLQYVSNNFQMVSAETGKQMTIYYKAYTDFEKALLQANIGKVVRMETAIYDAHSSGYFRLLPNVYDYPMVELQMTDAQKVEAVKGQLEAAAWKSSYKDGDELVLPQTTVEGATVTWAVSPEGVLVDGVIHAVEPGQLTLTATITVGEASDTFVKEVAYEGKNVEVTTEIVDQPVAGETYKLYINQIKANKELYFAGEMSGNYLATTEELASGKDVTVEEVEGGYRLAFETAEGKRYIDIYEYQENKFGVTITAEPTAVFTWDATVKTFIADVKGERYLGTYSTYTTISQSSTSYITGDNAANVDVTQFPVRLLKVTYSEIVPNTGLTEQDPLTASEAIVVAEAAGETATTQAYYVKGVVSSIPTAYNEQYGNITVVITDGTSNFQLYRLTVSSADAVELGDEIVVLGNLVNYKGNTPQMTAGGTLVSCVKGEAPEPQPEEFDTVHAGTLEDPFDVADALTVAVATGQTPTQEQYYIKGVVSKIQAEYNAQYGNISVVLYDGAQTFLVYRVLVTSATDIEVNDEIVVLANIVNYAGNTPETVAGGTLISSVKGVGPVEPINPDPEDGVVLDFTAQGYANAEEVTSLTVDGVTVTFDKGTNNNAPKYYTTGDAVRVYGGGYFTVASSEMQIVKIEITFGGSDGSNALTASVGTLEGGMWIGEASSVTFTVGGTTGQRRIAKLVVTLGEAGTPEPEPEFPETVHAGTEADPFGAADALAVAEFTGTTATADAYYIKGVVSSIKTAYNSQYGNISVYITEGEVEFLIYRLTVESAEAVEVGDEIVVLANIVNYNNNTPETTAGGTLISCVKAENPEPEFPETVHAGTEADPFGAADALAVAEFTGTTATADAYYIKGVVSSIKTAYNSQYGNISVYITEGEVEFLIYRLTVESAEAVEVGDEIVVLANIVNYNNNTPETAAGGTLVSCVKGEKPEPQPTDAIVLDFTAQGYANAEEVTSLTVDGVTVTFDKGTNNNAPKYYSTGNAIRVYGGGYFTVASEMQIVKVEITFASGEGSNALSASVGTLEGGLWEGEANSVTFTVGGTSGHRRIAKLVVTLGEAGTPEPEPEFPETVHAGTEADPFGAADALAVAEFTGTTATADAYYIKGVVSSIKTAYNSQYGNISVYITEGEVEFLIYRLTVESAEAVEVGDEIVVLANIVNYNNNTPETAAGGTLISCVKAENPEPEFPETVHAGTEADPFGAADALAVAEFTGTTATADAYYIKGVVSSIKTAYNSQYGNISVYITEGEVEFLIYRLTVESAEAVEVGDEIVVLANIVNYNNNTPETTAGGTLVSCVKPEPEQTSEVVSLDFTAQGYTNAQEVASLTVDGVTVTFDKGTNSNAPKYYTSGAAIRVYGGGYFTVASEMQIVKVEITFASGEGSNALSASVGTLEGGLWEGEANSVTFTVGGTSGNRRIAKIVVTLA